MAETTSLRNTQSRRYSTTRPLGFRGGSISPGGNMQPPTAGQVSGINPAAPKAQAQDPMAQFSAAVPRPAVTSPAAAVATGVGGQLATSAAKKGIEKYFPSASKGLNFNDTAGPVAGDMAKAGGGIINPTSGAETFPYRDTPPVGSGTPLSDAGSGIGSYGDSAQLLDPTIGFEEGATSLAGDAAGGFDFSAFDPTIGFEEGATSLMGDAAGSFADVIPYAGSILNAAQGNWGGAAGGAIGTLFGGPIGGFIGGTIGGAVEDACFITEAVMSAGGQDGGPELEILRGFRDQVMMSTPIGQSMVQQYEAIAPLVVEAVTQRPDALDIFQSIKAQFIDPAVAAAQAGDNNQALMIYAKMIAFVTPFAIEAQVGPGGNPDDRVEDGQEGMDQMGSMAAMLEHSPEMATAATGGPDMGGMMMQNGQLPGGPGQTTSPPVNMQNGAMQPPMAGTFARRRY